MAENEHFDVVVVGAGISSLAAAKEYMQCAPKTNLVILNDNKTIGGVWSEDRIYPGLRTNNFRGTLELPDHPFGDHLGIKYLEHPTGEALHRYFLEYADKFNLVHRVRHETKALEAQKLEDGWRLRVDNKGRQYSVTTDKLIVGTGLQVVPQRMHLKGEESFNAPRFHAGDLVEARAVLGKDNDVHRVTVCGGSKYGWDCIYDMAAAGKEVDWILRKSGHGPTWISKVMIKVPLLGAINAEKLFTTRIVDWMSPCIFEPQDGSGWWRRFLHGTWLGRKMVQGFWHNVGENMLNESGFRKDASTKILEPDCECFDAGTNFASMNYPTDILDFVRTGQIKVHREDISHLADHAIHLANGTVLESDGIIASSGWLWRPALDFKDKHLHADLGLPSTDYTPAQMEHWDALDRKADEEIFTKLPMLKTRPRPPHSESARQDDVLNDLKPAEKKPIYTPQRFYHALIPAGLPDRTLAFVGCGANVSHASKAELSGLWIYAYFNDKLTVDPVRDVQDLEYEAALMQRLAYRRHTYGYGERHPDYVWDGVPFHDVLLRDLGMNGRRKGSWIREWFEPYEPKDYRGVTEEWLAMQERQKSQCM